MMLHYPLKKSKLLIVLLFLVFFSSIGYSLTYEHFVSDYTADLDDDWIWWGNASAIDLLNTTSQDPADDGYTGSWYNTTTVSDLGTINSLYFAAAWAVLTGSGSDYWRIDYGVASTPGDCSTVGTWLNLTTNVSTTTPYTYFNITNISVITWSDLDNICFSPWYEKVGGDDNIEADIDAFWVKIDYTPGAEPVENTKPNITTPSIIPSIVYANDTMNCSTVASDDENVTLYINFTWYDDGVKQDAYDSLQTCSNSTICYTGILVPNTTTSEGEGWNCTTQAWDAIPPAGLNSSWNNTYEIIQNITTNNVTVFKTPDPVNVTLDAKFQANYTDKNDNPIVNVSVCNIDFQIGAGGWVGAVWMTWNGTSEMYEYTRSFPNIEVVNVSTVCVEGNYTEQTNMTNITVQAGLDINPPQIIWEDPTPDPDETVYQNSVYLNTTITDAGQTSAFFDWNRSLVGYWNFEYVTTGGTVYDNSTYGRDLVMRGYDQNITVDGIYGEGIYFDGSNDHLNRSDASNDLVPDAFSISVWVNPISINTGLEAVLGKGIDIGSDRTKYSYHLAYNRPTADHFRFDISYSTGWTEVGTATAITGGWHHIVATYNSTNISIYLDGVLENSTTPGGAIHKEGGVFDIGRDNNNGGGFGYFNGTIDEIQIHNRVLTPEEINASYNNSVYRLYHNFTDLDDGVYNYTACAIDTGGYFNCTVDRNVTVDTTAVANLTFTIETVNASNENYSILTFPGNTTLDIWFNGTTPDQKYILPCIETGSPPSAECQNLTSPIIKVKNIGSTSFNITIRLNESLIGNITIFANFSNSTNMADCPGWSLAPNNTIITTTLLNFTRGMCVNNVTDVWLFANYTDYTQGETEMILNYSSHDL